MKVERLLEQVNVPSVGEPPVCPRFPQFPVTIIAGRLVSARRGVYCLRETARRILLATARPPLNAGMNFHPVAAWIRSASPDLVFPVGSADRTFPAESITSSMSNSACGKPCSGLPNRGGRHSRIGSGGITAGLLPADPLVASKIVARFVWVPGPPADTPLT